MTTKTLLTNSFRVHAAQKFSTEGSLYYAFAGNHIEYPGGDASITTPVDSIQATCSDVYQNMVFGRLLDENASTIMCPRYNWVANTVYAQYDDTDGDLPNKNYFVMVDSNTRKDVFKCLFNNGGLPSTVQPDLNATGADDEYYETNDGYQWKYMFSIPVATFRRFATDAWIPVVPNANVTGNAISGSIDVILVANGGSNYDTVLSGQFTSNNELRINGNELIYLLSDSASSNSDFYNGASITITSGVGAGQLRTISDYIVANGEKRMVLSEAFTFAPDVGSEYEITPSITVKGDGANLVARPLVNTAASNTIYKVEIISRGNNYTFADLAVVGNTGGVSNSATLRAIIPPKGGHGSDVYEECQATSIGISIQFSNNENGSIPINNDIRQIGVIRDPMWANVVFNIANVRGVFQTGDTVLNFSPEHFAGKVTFSENGNTVFGTETSFSAGLAANDYIFISNGTSSALRRIVSITSNSELQVDRAFSYTMSAPADFYKAYVVATGVITNSSANSIQLTNVTGAPNPLYWVSGVGSDAYANISSFAVNGRTAPGGYPFFSFDQRWRYNVQVTAGEFTEDEQVFTSNMATQNAYIHQTNSTYLALTNKYGDIGNTITGNTSGAQANVVSYVIPDLVPMSGKVLYIENTDPFTRANNQSETFKIVLDF